MIWWKLCGGLSYWSGLEKYKGVKTGSWMVACEPSYIDPQTTHVSLLILAFLTFLLNGQIVITTCAIRGKK